MRLDHINVRTGRLEDMQDWYTRVLGLKSGWRPDFPFPGAWMYAGDYPIVHLVGRDETPSAEDAELRLEHFALRGDDLKAFRARLEAEGVASQESQPPGMNLLQINIYDPDGNHIHVDFEV